MLIAGSDRFKYMLFETRFLALTRSVASNDTIGSQGYHNIRLGHYRFPVLTKLMTCYRMSRSLSALTAVSLQSESTSKAARSTRSPAPSGNCDN